MAGRALDPPAAGAPRVESAPPAKPHQGADMTPTTAPAPVLAERLIGGIGPIRERYLDIPPDGTSGRAEIA